MLGDRFLFILASMCDSLERSLDFSHKEIEKKTYFDFLKVDRFTSPDIS